MVSGEGSSIYGVRTSSVVPAAVTGETAVHELGNLDLALKLHYLRAVYFFEKEAVEGLDMPAYKRPMFPWLDTYCSVSGRIRRAEGGRPFVKCNDAGVRVVEAKCSKSLEEWLEAKDDLFHKQLVSGQAIEPGLQFSPLVFLQFTWFKCGGMALGFSWAHIIGDAVTASTSINLWGKMLGGKPKLQAQHLPRAQVERPEKATKLPHSVKHIEPVKDRWIAANHCKMDILSFPVSANQLKQLGTKIPGQFSAFEAISAVIWHYLARVRKGSQPELITICRNDAQGKGEGMLSNKQIISTVQADFPVAEAGLPELAKLIAGGTEDESKEIEGMMEAENGLADVLLYGANLTFVDLADVDFYGLEIKGRKPVHVSFSIDGIGDEGAVLVHKEVEKREQESGGRVVTLILPETHMWELRNELKREWNIN